MKKMLMLIAGLTILFTSALCFAGDAELYTLINGKTYEMTVGSVNYSLDFYGINETSRIGTAYLIWNDYIILDGHEYPIPRYIAYQYLVSGNVIRIPVSDANGVVTVYYFIPDYEGAIRMIANDFRFFPVTE